MSDTADLAYKLMKRLHGEFGAFRGDLTSVKTRLSSVEQHQAATVADIARINIELDELRGDVSLIKHRLDLVDG